MSKPKTGEAFALKTVLVITRFTIGFSPTVFSVENWAFLLMEMTRFLYTFDLSNITEKQHTKTGLHPLKKSNIQDPLLKN